MSKSPKTKPPTRREIAKALGITERRVSQLILEGMPTSTVDAAVAWRAAQADGDSAEKLRQERIKLVQSQRQKIDLANAVRRGELIESGFVHAEILRMVSQAKGEFLKLANDLPPRVVGLDEPRIFRIIRDEVIAILTRLSDESSETFPPVEKDG